MTSPYDDEPTITPPEQSDDHGSDAPEIKRHNDDGDQWTKAAASLELSDDAAPPTTDINTAESAHDRDRSREQPTTASTMTTDGLENMPELALDLPTPSHARTPASPWRLRLLLGGLAAITIAIVVVLGLLSSRHYYLVCADNVISPRKGRFFPPWGQRNLHGQRWTPIATTAAQQSCNAQFASTQKLRSAFLTQLTRHLERSTAALAREIESDEQVERATRQLEQARLLVETSDDISITTALDAISADITFHRATRTIDHLREKITATQADFAKVRAGNYAARAAQWYRSLGSAAATLESPQTTRQPEATQASSPHDSPPTKPAQPQVLVTPPDPQTTDTTTAPPPDSSAGRPTAPTAHDDIPQGGVLL